MSWGIASSSVESKVYADRLSCDLRDAAAVQPSYLPDEEHGFVGVFSLEFVDLCILSTEQYFVGR